MKNTFLCLILLFVFVFFVQSKTGFNVPAASAATNVSPSHFPLDGWWVPRVSLIPQYPKPLDEVVVTIDFWSSRVVSPHYDLILEANTFIIDVWLVSSILPTVTHVVFNVSLGYPPIGSYQVKITGYCLYYPRILKFVVGSVHTIDHFVELYHYPFKITTESNSTISAFAVNPEEKQIAFNASVEDGASGFCNVTFSKLLLDGKLLLFVDYSLTEYILSQNAASYSLYFTLSHGMHSVKIKGAFVAEPPLPEIFRVPDVNPTIQEAIDTANAGDTIRVKAGIYFENLFVDVSVSLVGENCTTTIIDGNATRGFFGISVRLTAPNVSISGFTIRDGLEGIAAGTDCNISHNVVTDNSDGIVLYGDGNTVSCNSVTQNEDFGIYVCGTGNRIYHNCFANNCMQGVTSFEDNVWDDGYPSGGNYWSDYSGADADHDGIGDVPYSVPDDSFDQYPLMGIFSDSDGSSDQAVQAISNSTISNFRSNVMTISFDVSGEAGTTGFCRICIPAALMNEPYRIFVNGTEVSYELLASISNITHNYMYFSYTHSTKEVIIIPEFPETFIVALFAIATLTAVLTVKRVRVSIDETH